VKQLRCDQHERHGHGGHDLRAEVIAGVLHARQQGDDRAGQYRQHQ
jgi:hypothetical protein